MNIKIPVEDLQLNTVIANDVYNEDFQLIITEGTVLTSKVLDRLKLFNVNYVYISSGDDDAIPFTETEEFIKFKEAYTDVADKLKNALNGIAQKNISEKELENTINSCLELYSSYSSSPSPYGIFDMLHHMRDFSDSTFVHSINVGMIAAIIGRWSGKAELEEHLLVACGMFHDIGKLLIPADILNKPGKLTEDEFEIMKTHAEKGYELLKNLNIDERIKKCALMHHEKINGSGYPQGLRGNQIDDFAKIITIADIYDALTATRVYRGPICPFDVIEIFEKDGIKLYDTRYVLVFLQNIINTYLHSHVQLSNGESGEIIMVNTNNLSKPIVHSGSDFIDLSKNKDIKIEKIF